VIDYTEISIYIDGIYVKSVFVNATDETSAIQQAKDKVLIEFVVED
jgi:hypothetical protein